MSSPVKMGIVGLGRWAKVLTRAVAGKSDKLQIVAGYSRSNSPQSSACLPCRICKPCYRIRISRA
jgi:predicted dehydrogenase